jgi:hypothetical protein
MSARTEYLRQLARKCAAAADAAADPVTKAKFEQEQHGCFVQNRPKRPNATS